MKILNFFKNHPIITNFILMIIVFFLIIFFVLTKLDSYTNHGKAVTVPDVKGLQVEVASSIFTSQKLNYSVVDSIFVKNAVPGSILETMPPIGTSVKEGRTIYLTVNSETAKLLLVPDVIDMSQRQGISMLKSLGFESVESSLVPGAYKGLVMGLEARGREIMPGEQLTADTPLTILVSSGELEEEFIFPEEGDVIGTTEEESWF